MVGRTVNGLELLVAMLVVTATCTEPALPSLGTWTMIELELQDKTVAVTAPNVTVLVP